MNGTPALPLAGGRKKANRRPRNDAVVKLSAKHRDTSLYARVYKPGQKRAVYRSLFTRDTAAAEQVFQHVRAAILRGQKTDIASIQQLSLL